MQFTTRQLFIELTIVAAFFGLARFMDTTHLSDPIDYLLPAVLAGLVGAFVGGVRRQYLFGAIIGFVSWLTVLLSLMVIF
jgi:hypothetical protein